MADKRRQKKQSQGSESEQTSSSKSQGGRGSRWERWLKKTENLALVFSLIFSTSALGFTALNAYHEWYPPLQRAKLTIFIEHYNFGTGTTGELNYDIWGKIVNDSPLSTLIRRWGLVLTVNTSYTIVNSRFNMPDLSFSISEQVSFTMGHTLMGVNGTMLHETMVKGSMAWIEYEDDIGLQIAQKEFNFVS